MKTCVRRRQNCYSMLTFPNLLVLRHCFYISSDEIHQEFTVGKDFEGGSRCLLQGPISA